VKNKLREAQLEDLPGILEIYNDVVATTTAIYDEFPRNIEQQTQWYHAKKEGCWPIIICEQEAHVVGFASYGSFRAWPGYRHTVELSLHVAKAWRGQGVGSRLLEALIAKAKEQEFHTIIAGIDSENKASILLHKKFDFQISGELKQVARKFDRWLDLTFMQRLI